MYYEGGVSSVYLWDLDDGGFAGVVLLKKSEYLALALDPIQVEVYLSLEWPVTSVSCMVRI